MKERQILFSAPMIRSLLAGTKTQTRRFYCDSVMPEGLKSYQQEELKLIDGIVHGRKAGATEFKMMVGGKGPRGEGNPERCPYGAVGDRLWVRETWRALRRFESHKPRDLPNDSMVAYAAENYIYPDDRLPSPQGRMGKLRPGIFMPRWASRIMLELTEVRVQRLQDISEQDSIAEGSPSYEEGVDALPPDAEHEWSYRAAYRAIWEAINGAGSWEANPWCWALTFKRVEQANG